MQTVSPETAQRLEAAGLEWKPAVGDRTDRGGPVIGFAATRDRVAFPGGKYASVDECLWLPRLDQVMDEIERLVLGAIVTFCGHNSGGRFCWVTSDRGFARGEGVGPNDTEAAGLALVKILETLPMMDAATLDAMETFDGNREFL